MAVGIALAAGLGVALWWYGHRQKRPNGPRWSILVPLSLGATAFFAELPVATAIAAPVSQTASRQPFSEKRLAALRAEGRPVFLDFTADWCLTCKVNERVAIDTATARNAFRNGNVVQMVGDWTRGDPAITAFLAKHDRNSIPFYLFYPAGGEPVALPQILSGDMIARTVSEGSTAAGRPDFSAKGSDRR